MDDPAYENGLTAKLIEHAAGDGTCSCGTSGHLYRVSEDAPALCYACFQVARRLSARFCRICGNAIPTSKSKAATVCSRECRAELSRRVQRELYAARKRAAITAPEA